MFENKNIEAARAAKLEEPKNKPDPNAILQSAIAYNKAGLSVIPVKPLDKSPLTGAWAHMQNGEHKLTPEQIKGIWGSPEVLGEGLIRNIGVICGQPITLNDGVWYLLIIDFDDQETYAKWDNELKKTLTSLTGKGVHCWYMVRTPPKTHHLKQKLGVPIDLQGYGAYTVEPSSWHNERQVPYRWVFGYSIDDIPDKIMKVDWDLEQSVFDWIDEHPEFLPKDKDKKAAWQAEKCNNDIDTLLAGVEKGCRDEAAVKIATWLKQGGVSRDDAIVRLRDWNKNNKPPMGADRNDTHDVEGWFTQKVDSAYDHDYHYLFTHQMTLRDKEELVQLDAEMIAFLKDPTLFDSIMCILDTIIVGEASLKALHLCVGVGASFLPKPFGIIIIDTFGAGKSYTQRSITDKVFPESRVSKPTSFTPKAVNYLQENFHGRICRVDELFGEEEGMEDIRVWMTEGRLERWVTNSDTMVTETKSVEGCPAFFTSTTKTVEEQYGSRNWIANVDTSKKQTYRIHQFDYMHDALPNDFFADQEAQAKFLQKIILWLMQNSKPVIIPFSYTFPLVTRARRDRTQFKQLIMDLANIFQLQRKTMTRNGKEYIIAQKEDFDLALKIAGPFLYQTMKTLDKYAIEIIKWAQTKQGTNAFSTPDFWRDFQKRNSGVQYRTIARRFEALKDSGYIEEQDEIFSTHNETWYRLTDLGMEGLAAGIKLVDDGKWLLDLYDKLDDPIVREQVRHRFAEIQRQGEEDVTEE